MHEISIMQSTLELAEESARKANCTEILAIRLRVGLLSGVVPEALEFAFDVLKMGSMMENARLEIERVPASFSCSGCGLKDLLSDVLRFDCPECGGFLTVQDGANDLELAQLEVN